MHPLDPVYDEKSRTLILGSMPSVVSRRNMKYYAHPQNRFWRTMEDLYEESASDWREFILRHHLALWDVIKTCDISSSSDASIKNVEVNDIAELIAKTNIENIFVLGKKGYDLYNRYVKAKTGIEAIYLPSPSAANATISKEELAKIYSIIKEVTK